ncbi:MAG: PaaI family thioesterase, partial [Burkholderiales bacterium]
MNPPAPSRPAAGHFPSGDPVTHARALPYARALGLHWQDVGPARAGLRLPFSDRVADARRGTVHPLALLGQLDQACSAAVFAGLEQPALIATLDLRVDYAAPPAPQGELLCTAQTTYMDASTALVRAHAVCVSSGATVAYASSAYAIGAHPGMRDREATVRQDSFAPDPAEWAPHDSFEQMIDLQRDGDGWVMPFHRRLVGAASLPSLHGGSTGAAMALAAVDLVRGQCPPVPALRWLGLSVRYLR